jgi:hypothetical protein
MKKNNLMKVHLLASNILTQKLFAADNNPQMNI